MMENSIKAVAQSLHPGSTARRPRGRAKQIIAQGALGLALVAVGGASLAAVSANTSRCSTTFFSGVAPTGVTIKSANLIAATSTVPEYCSVLATVATPGNTVDFLTGYPSSWNEHFVWASQGGLAGQPMTLTNAFLQAGYATGVTDTGHQGSPAFVGGAGRDPTFVYDIAKFTDYGHRANKYTADATKSLIASYYGSAIKRSIFNGCSNGGRSVMINAERYPGQFDAYVVGAPFISETESALDWLHSEKAFFAKPTSFMPAAKLTLLGNAVLAACDTLDGVKDGLVSNPLACRFDPRGLQCGGADNPSCLTKDQVDAVVFWNTDWKNRAGEVVSRRWLLTGVEGEPSGTTLYQIGPNPAPLDAKGVPYPTAAQNNGYSLMIAILGDMVHGDHAYDYRNFSINDDVAYLAQVDGVLSAWDTNIMPAVNRGAKFIFYQGWADPALNPMNTLDYRDALIARYGANQVNNFMRLFMVPGMTHCGGGSLATDQFDLMMPAIEKWMDTGVAPDVVNASHVTGGVVTRTRPLCAFPKYARYKGAPGTASIFGVEDGYYFYCSDQTP